MLPEYALYKGDVPLMIGNVFDICLKYELQLDYIEYITDNNKLIEKSVNNGTYDEQYIVISV